MSKPKEASGFWTKTYFYVTSRMHQGNTALSCFGFDERGACHFGTPSTPRAVILVSQAPYQALPEYPCKKAGQNPTLYKSAFRVQSSTP
eukprot:1529365-Amphidinium_carterae.1